MQNPCMPCWSLVLSLASSSDHHSTFHHQYYDRQLGEGLDTETIHNVTDFKCFKKDLCVHEDDAITLEVV